MPKAREVLRALRRDGWQIVRETGSSHKIMRKGERQATWGHHPGRDLGRVQMAQVAQEFGYTVDELRRL